MAVLLPALDAALGLQVSLRGHARRGPGDGECLPLTRFLRIVRGIILEGAALGTLLREVAAIVAFFPVALLIAIANFRKRLS